MLVFIFRLLSLLPLPVLHGFGWILGWLAYALAPSHRKRLRTNLAQAGYADLLNDAIGEAGKSMFELPFAWCASPARIRRAVRFANWELVQQSLNAGQGIVFITPHLGCFELTAQRVSQEIPLTVMYRPPRQTALKPLVEGARANDRLALAPATLGGVRQLLKALKNNRPIGILPDQVPQNGEGVWAPFFGRQAYTMTLPNRLQSMSGAPFLLTFAERLPWGRGYLMRFFPLAIDAGDDAVTQASKMNAAMEALIAHCPAQYNWSYNRYKTPPGVASPQDVS